MKAIIMESTIPFLFHSKEELEKFMVEKKYQFKQTQSKINYIVKHYKTEIV